MRAAVQTRNDGGDFRGNAWKGGSSQGKGLQITSMTNAWKGGGRKRLKLEKAEDWNVYQQQDLWTNEELWKSEEEKEFEKIMPEGRRLEKAQSLKMRRAKKQSFENTQAWKSGEPEKAEVISQDWDQLGAPDIWPHNATLSDS